MDHVDAIVTQILADYATLEPSICDTIRTFADLHDICDANEYFERPDGTVCTLDEQAAIIARVNAALA